MARRDPVALVRALCVCLVAGASAVVAGACSAEPVAPVGPCPDRCVCGPPGEYTWCCPCGARDPFVGLGGRGPMFTLDGGLFDSGGLLLGLPLSDAGHDASDAGVD